MTFFFAPENIPFASALCIMLLIALMEGVLTIIGFGLSRVLDNLIPETDFDVDISELNGLSKILAWLRVGQIPLLILIVIFLTVFGLSGFIIQYILLESFGWMLPALLISVPAFYLGLQGARTLGGILGKWMLKDETQAIKKADFIGQTVTLTLGTCSVGSAAEAKFKDRFGTTHYLMVEPDADETFYQGEELLLVRYEGNTFYGIRAVNKH